MIFNDNLPIYLQVMNLIRKKLVLGEIKEGDKLSSVRELSTEFKVNPNTIQRAYQELEREGLVYTQRGMGTFVTEEEKIINKLKNDMASNMVKTFIQEMKSIGYEGKDIVKLINESVREEE